MYRADEIVRNLWGRTWDWERPEGMAQIADALREYAKAERERLERCKAALRKSRMLLVNEGDPDKYGEMIAEIDALVGDTAPAALEGK